MKSKLPFLFLFLILSLFISHCAFAQSDFRPGFVILNSGDTLHGTIDYRGDFLMSTICKFKKGKNAQTLEYYPNDIKGYRFTDSKYFESKEVTTETGKNSVFLEFLVKGELNVFYYRGSKGEHYLIEKEGRALVKLPYKKEIQRMEDGNRYEITSKKHIGLLKVYMDDAPSLYSKIDKFDKIEHNSIINLAVDYHNEVCKENKCIVFERKTPFFRLFPELVFRGINYKDKGIRELYVDRNYFSAGILLNLQMRLNEKVYITTGVLRTSLEKKPYPYSKYTRPREVADPMVNFYKFPLHFGYTYPKGPIKPRLSYGINLINKPFFITNSLTAGANIKLYKSLSLSIFGESEFNNHERFFLLPYSLYAYSVGTGLYFSL